MNVNTLLTFYESQEHISYTAKKLLELQGGCFFFLSFVFLFWFFFLPKTAQAFQEAHIWFEMKRSFTSTVKEMIYWHLGWIF